MFVLMLFAATAVVGTYLFASSAMTAALSVSAIYDRVSAKNTAGAGSTVCESAGLVALILGFVLRATDPFYATHAMFIGALLLALGAMIRPCRETARPDALVKRAQVAHYRAALACLATLAVFQWVAPLVH